jgi:hypothetical protein
MAHMENAPSPEAESASVHFGGLNGSVYNTAPVVRTIEIREEPFSCGFDVVVIPPVPDEPLDAEFRHYRQAHAWADGLRRTRGWRIIDQTGGGI